MTEKRRLAIASGALALATVLYALLVVKDFSGPLIGTDDTPLYEYLGYHLRDHYRFGLPPDLGLLTNDVGYWHGTSAAYLPWCAERDLGAAALLRAFGPGPWLQLYAAASPAIGAFGTLFLLRREVGVTRAALVAFAGNFMAFYAAYKFPYHVNIACLHWCVLSIVCDFVITRRILEDRPIDALLLLVRAALMTLLIGLDLPYVAGYPLTFFTVSLAFWIGRWVFVARRCGVNLRSYFPKAPLADLAKTPILTALAAAGFLFGAIVYVPFAFAIVRGSRVYSFDDAGGNFWASWPRLLLPFLPGANPSSGWVTGIFGDVEGVAEYCVGWALLGFAALGVHAAARRRAWLTVGPLLVTFLLCYAFHPKRFPTLHLFPWFFFNRVAGRSTVVFPLLLALMALQWEPRGKRVLYILFGLALAETATAYTLVNHYTPMHFDAQVRAYFAAVRGSDGEAILEWPFCVAGGNGVGTSELCPYYGVQSTAFTNRRFFDKKVVSFYFSRLHPSQVTPRAELAALFNPDDPDVHKARRETRCFDDGQWALFDRTYHQHDFGGIQLYVDRLPASCVEQFHARYGAPAASAIMPGLGRVELLRRAPRPRTVE